MRAKLDSKTEESIKADIEVLAKRFHNRSELSREAAGLLFFRYGMYPSVQLVHRYTRLGSMTDINKDLDNFWNEIREKSRVAISAHAVPEDLASVFGDLITKMWSRSVEAAEESLDSLKKECEEEVAKAQSELARLRAELSELVRSSEASNLAREAAERDLAVERSEKNIALQKVADTENLAANEIRARQESEARFMEELISERQARKESEEVLAGEIRFAKLQIDESRESARQLRERFNSAEADHSLVVNQLKQKNNALLEENGTMRLSLGELRGQTAALTSERDRLLIKVEELSNRLELSLTAKNNLLVEQIQASLKARFVAMAAAFEVAEHFGASLTFPDRESTSLCLSISGIGDTMRQITPIFSSLEDLEAFCDTYIDNFTSIGIGDAPHHFFWESQGQS